MEKQKEDGQLRIVPQLKSRPCLASRPRANSISPMTLADVEGMSSSTKIRKHGRQRTRFLTIIKGLINQQPCQPTQEGLGACLRSQHTNFQAVDESRVPRPSPGVPAADTMIRPGRPENVEQRLGQDRLASRKVAVNFPAHIIKLSNSDATARLQDAAALHTCLHVLELDPVENKAHAWLQPHSTKSGRTRKP